MAKTRRKSFPIETAAQLRVISSPVSFAIIQTLQHLGPGTVRELGPRIGRKPNSLHYHMRRLVNTGMVRKTGTRRSGARTEAIYDVTANRFIGSGLSDRPALLRPVNEGVASLLRLATRNFAKATETRQNLRETGNRRNILARHVTARLTNNQLSELNDCINRIDEIFASSIGSEDGQMCALTMVLTPIDTANN